jgi:putative ABC transport system ATP-binding protein
MQNQTQISIEIHDIIKIYKRKGVETSALRGMTTNINKGEITVIMGPSGCGKTTLMNIISGVSRPNAGKVVISGEDITQFSEDELENYRRDKISYIFQQLNLIPSLNVWDNITFALEYTNRFTPTEEQRIHEIIDLVGLTEHLKKYPDELSGGEQQRVALTAAVAKNSEIILCDEPTGELDSKSKLIVMELITLIKEKYPDKTIVIVTHDPDFKMIADRLLYIRDGRISFEISSEKLEEMKHHTNLADNLEVTDHHTLQNSNDEDLIMELREINKIIHDKLEFYEKRQKQKSSLKKMNSL